MRIAEKNRGTGKGIAIPPRWHKATVQRQADLEKIRISLLRQVSNALKSIKKKYHWDEAYLFGSVAQEERFRQNSDIDIAISGLDKFEHYAFTAEISELLEKSIDVVLLEECPFAQSIKEKGLKWNRKTGF
jgi:predicted nucleotidyltransferase